MRLFQYFDDPCVMVVSIPASKSGNSQFDPKFISVDFLCFQFSDYFIIIIITKVMTEAISTDNIMYF
jgi:hypothetical protein